MLEYNKERGAYMLNTVGQKGQIVIEKAIREQLGLQPGYVAVQKLAGDHVEIFFYPPEHRQSLRGILASKTTKRVANEEWTTLRERAWSEAGRVAAQESTA